jgi:hypothetical protein
MNISRDGSIDTQVGERHENFTLISHFDNVVITQYPPDVDTNQARVWIGPKLNIFSANLRAHVDCRCDNKYSKEIKLPDPSKKGDITETLACPKCHYSMTFAYGLNPKPAMPVMNISNLL